MTTYGEVVDGFNAPIPPAIAGELKRQQDLERRRRRRAFFVRTLLVLLLLLLMFLIRFIPNTWNPFQLANAVAFTGLEVDPGAAGQGAAAAGNAGGSGGGGPVGGIVGGTSNSNTETKSQKTGSGDSSAGGSSLMGPAGPQGPAGRDGAVGPQGPAGAAGPAGPQGAAGANGADGTSAGVSSGNGTGSVGACDSNVDVSLRSSWDGTDFKVAQVKLYNVSNACNGLQLTLQLYNGTTQLFTIVVPNVTITGGEIIITPNSSGGTPSLGTIRSLDVTRVVMEIAA